MVGVGETVDSCAGHWSLSVDTKGCSLLSELEGCRRARAWTLAIEGSERRVERMWEPCHGKLAGGLEKYMAASPSIWGIEELTTRPVLPTMAAEVILQIC